VAGLFGVLALILPSGSEAQSGPGKSIPSFDHVFILMMENHAYGQVIGNHAGAPYINQLAGQFGLAANYFGVAHPSLPNYLALAGGDTFGITDDCLSCFVSGPNLVVDRIAASGRTWRAYMEQLPSECFLGDAYPYAQRHNPFIYFDDIRTTGQCGNIVAFSSLAADLASSATTADYIWITPDVCHDTHDCSVTAGDSWLASVVPEIINSPAYATQNSLLVITWDEDDYSQNNRVPTLVVARSVPAGFVSNTKYDHYSLVRTIEEAWDLAPLTHNDAGAMPLSDFFAGTDASAGMQLTPAPSADAGN